MLCLMSKLITKAYIHTIHPFGMNNQDKRKTIKIVW